MRHLLIATLLLTVGCRERPGGTATGSANASASTTPSGLASTSASARLGAPKVFTRPTGATFRPKDFATKTKAEVEALGFGSRPLGPAIPPKLCVPTTAVDESKVDNALFVRDKATLNAKDFSLKRTLQKLAADAVAAGAPAATAEGLFISIWDTQNTQAQAKTPGEGAHCDHNGGLLNGFPYECRPVDGSQATAGNIGEQIDAYKPIALVNRIDLADENWMNCGEHRIVYGRHDGGTKKSFLIFEAVLPNPRPGCASGVDGRRETRKSDEPVVAA